MNKDLEQKRSTTNPNSEVNFDAGKRDSSTRDIKQNSEKTQTGREGSLSSDVGAEEEE